MKIKTPIFFLLMPTAVFGGMWIYEAFDTGRAMDQVFESYSPGSRLLVWIGTMSVAGFLNSFALDNFYPNYQNKGPTEQRYIHIIGFVLCFGLVSSISWMLF
ncbi:hypothetical protein [Vibrio salinus]|uniref:hypothetical protein n=1 Tax=Vibrio salinus TaxID=2899784 RepID=UPI001E395129|nr:hypothetical protein [Vibrio salinus]MCE0495174.1 hypothetical protein [Vibrio salinus]